MPYIKPEDRGRAEFAPVDAGELNFAITRLLIDYSNRIGLDYQVINDISGAVTEALAEYRRRVTAAYEPMKIAENGDVYPATFPTPKAKAPSPNRPPPRGAGIGGPVPDLAPPFVDDMEPSKTKGSVPFPDGPPAPDPAVGGLLTPSVYFDDNRGDLDDPGYKQPTPDPEVSGRPMPAKYGDFKKTERAIQKALERKTPAADDDGMGDLDDRAPLDGKEDPT